MSKTKNILWWIFAVIFTLAIAVYQRMTGPTYPVKGKATLNGQEIKYKLIRTAENDKDAEISLTVPDTSISGLITYKRFKSHDSLTSVAMHRSGDKLFFLVPKQPSAGKIEYNISLRSNNNEVSLSKEPVVMRFKGPVPAYILIPHILLMFLAMLFSTRTGIEALLKGVKTYKYALVTLILLIPGGLILGPIMQKFAFGAYWTGWPFGHDLTDNKTFVAALFWIIALIKLRKDPTNRTWPVIAAIMFLAVFLIPHSVLGSEIDYTQQPK